MITADTGKLDSLRRAKDLLDARYSTPLKVEDVAATVGYSPHHLSREFRRLYGESPGRYLTRRRIERAQDLLRGSDLTVTEICLLVGFTSLGTFSTTFKRAVGLTPTAYRDRERTSGGAPVVPGCVLLMRAMPELPPAR